MVFCFVLFFSFCEISKRFQKELSTNILEVLHCERFNRVYPKTVTSHVFYNLGSLNNK